MNYLLVFEIMGKRYAELHQTKRKAINKAVMEIKSLGHWTLYDSSLKICDSSGEHLEYRGAILD